MRRALEPGGAATKERADARNQLADTERFREVVVGAALEAEDLVGLFATRRQHENRHIGILGVAADGAAHGHTVQTGQHEIEHHEVERFAPGKTEGFGAVDGAGCRESFQFQVQEDQVANVLVVFDDQDSRPGGCTDGCISGEHTSSVAGPRSPPGSHRPLS